MAKKTPRRKRKPNTLNAISGTDAIAILRILVDRDKELSKVIASIAHDILADVSLNEVADCVQAELESLAAEDVWDRSGARRDGYVDPGEAAMQVFELALEPFREYMLKHLQLSMLEQAQTICFGILRGIYDFHWHSSTEFKDWAVDVPVEVFEAYLGEWEVQFQEPMSTSKLKQFLTAHCPNWAK